MENWTDIHEDFAEMIYIDGNETRQYEWEEKGFTYQEAKAWIEAGLIPEEHEFALYLKEKNYVPTTVFQEKSHAQHWLDWKYPKEGACKVHDIINNVDNYDKTRDKITCLNISYKKHKGSLSLEGFVNLEKLYCESNQLTNLDLSDCINLRKLNCSNNYLTGLDFLTDLNEEKLTLLYISNNNLPESDLTPFSKFVNLEALCLGNYYDCHQAYEQNIYNRFHGSLKPLQRLVKLNNLDINNTDIDSGVEYLPDSLKEFKCSACLRKDAKVQAIYNLFDDKKWKIEMDEDGLIENFPQKLKEYKQKVAKEKARELLKEEFQEKDNQIQELKIQLEQIQKGSNHLLSRNIHLEQQLTQEQQTKEVLQKENQNLLNLYNNLWEQINNQETQEAKILQPTYGTPGPSKK